jgi:hypothetical protein
MHRHSGVLKSVSRAARAYGASLAHANPFFAGALSTPDPPKYCYDALWEKVHHDARLGFAKVAGLYQQTDVWEFMRHISDLGDNVVVPLAVTVCHEPDAARIALL